MIRIPIRDGICTFIDDADQLLISGFPWRLLDLPAHDLTYVHAWNGNQHLYMHRLITGAGPKEQVDHWDGNGLNNLRFNLRIATRSQNLANRRKQRGTHTSRFKAVYWDKSRNRWATSIHVNGKTRGLGRFINEEDAARAYDQAALDAWGRFARLNFPVELVTICSLHDLAIPESPCTCPPPVMNPLVQAIEASEKLRLVAPE